MQTTRENLEHVIRSKDPEFEDFVESLLKCERLDGQAVIGIAKVIVAGNGNELSEKQVDTFIQHGLLKGNYVEECSLGLEPILWSEMLYALDDGYCDHCRNIMENIEKD
ncbi:hypothetical protein [Bacillus cereus group sp. TH160LC]|uniref:hypothetical protein n=1 Tax=Bacillus cereus group sp. TH160LC TaxID=3018058 RepID=UPI0022E0AEE5|nr:hypothetical protein [Bacillus cereus group sp. TH160LC]MDA1652666.1 hypothetical protein [Bacillus cereus group sp. TH160LC]